MNQIRFYFHLFRFHLREGLSDLKSSLIGMVLFSFFVILLTQLWQRFSSKGSVFTTEEVFVYLGITETLYMTFLRTDAIRSASDEFLLSMVRPRSWLIQCFVKICGDTLAKRLGYFLMLIPTLILVGVWKVQLFEVFLRFLMMILVLSLPQAIFTLTFSTARLTLPQTEYLVLPFGKLFLALGGVFGPLSDYGEPWRSFLLYLPGSDLFFQPAFWAIKGHFYNTSPESWMLRTCGFCLFLRTA